MRNGVAVNDPTHRVFPTPTVAAPVDVPAQIPVPVDGTPFLVASVPRNNAFLDTDQQFVAMVIRLAQNSGNILSPVVLSPWD